ncbi:uncharacterized protein LTR77_004069 [Saxophila tyrrhenica]|uniref:Nuclear pore complex protein Nup85 n=1 Tax=Saxophila tyrrhenica TaxID=1690608 RepID=A0AAV9PCF1_9PEZI|nr:hypothetical protein LTR77_004069 [Saxophila tyrrhenica]
MATNFNFNFAGSPSTPKGKGKASLFSQAPSTTPAGPPPSYLTNVSTTPAGEPPRSSKIFGSSYNPATNTFGHRNTPARKGRTTFQVPESSPPGFEDGEDEDADGEMLSPERDAFVASTIEQQSPRGLKRSRNGQVREQESSGMADIARAFARDAGPAKTVEGPDDVVLGTEEVLASLDMAMHQQRNATASREETVTQAVTDLTRLWTQHSDNKTLPGAVGPELDEPLTKATYLSSLLLQLHHPHTARPAQKQASGLRSRSQQQSTSISLPRALLEWLNAHHNPLPDEFNDVHMYRPSPAAHEAFWDILGADIIRGRFSRVARLLRDAGWENAATAAMDYEDDRAQGYRGQQLHNIREVVENCIRVLESCPAVTDDDWNVPGPAWSVFRQRVRHAIRELEAFAATYDEHATAPPRNNMFANNNNMSMAAATARAESRVPPTIYTSLRAIYGVLLGGNGILDYAQDWVEASMLLIVWWDGEESSAALNVSVADLATSRNGFKKSLRAGGATREVDVAPLVAYRRRLGEMFRIVPSEINEPTFQPDTLDPLHVGLATAFEDDVAETIDMIRTWSQTVATAVVEISALGGWLPIPEGRPDSRGLLGRGFSTEDLLVLSHGPGARQLPYNGEGVVRDDVLTSYADLLADKEKYTSADGKIDREGWELAISVLGRLDETEAAEDRIRVILEALDIPDEPRVEKVLAVCGGMGFEALGRGIAERYADTISEQSPIPYGTTLLYHARAHSATKLRNTLGLLISLSLLHSAAIPAQTNLDPHLASLLAPARPALVDLARADSEAAELLARELSGYALLRRFYSIRDSTTSSTGSLMRKREAAKTLVALTSSAADCIRGGLFDPEVESVVPVEGLLMLLGEVLPLLGQTSGTGKAQRVMEMKDVMALMAVAEDYENVSGRIREGGEAVLKASMGCFRDGGMGGSGKLKKSTASLSASGMLGGSGGWEELAESSWELLRSQESGDGEGSKGRKGGKNARAVDVQRGWDWRKGLDAVASEAEVGSKEVVMLLRTALAREVGRAWGNGWA